MTSATRYRIHGGKALKGRATIAADVGIARRMAIVAALCEGSVRIAGHQPPQGAVGRDNPRSTDTPRSALDTTLQVLDLLGIESEAADTALRVEGRGLHGLRMPRGGLVECGADATTLKLVCGLLAGQRFGARLVTDPFLAELPLTALLEPLRARGAQISGAAIASSDQLGPPVSIAPLLEGETLHGLRCELAVTDPDTKSALFLSGLYASGPTAVWEPLLSPDHTERMLSALGVPVENMGPMVAVDPQEWAGALPAGEWEVPGSPSCAAAVMAALQMVPGSAAVLSGVGLNPSRGGMSSMLRLMGAPVQTVPRGETSLGEPLGDIRTQHHRGLRGGICASELLARMESEVGALLPLGATASGSTEVDLLELAPRPAAALRRLSDVAAAFGAHCAVTDLGLRIEGNAGLEPAHVSCAEDPDAAVAALLFSLAAPGESILEHAGCLELGCPGLVKVLRLLGADIVAEAGP